MVISADGPVLSSAHVYGSFDSLRSCYYSSFFIFHAQRYTLSIGIQKAVKITVVYDYVL